MRGQVDISPHLKQFTARKLGVRDCDKEAALPFPPTIVSFAAVDAAASFYL
jgi:hypothetical protein